MTSKFFCNLTSQEPFLLRKTGKNWDSVPLENVSVDDLDKESFDIFHREAIRSGRMSKDDLKLSNQDLLEKLNLLDGTMLKRAAILLFHRNPEKWITGSFVKIGFFETDADLRYQDEVHGSLMIQADRVIDLLYTKYLTAEISYDNITRIEHYPFPQRCCSRSCVQCANSSGFFCGCACANQRLQG